MFRHTGTTHPEQITTRALLAWITAAGTNNSVRARLSTGRAFLTWCFQTGLIDARPWETLPNITRQYPTTYGKVQSAHPARFLTHDEAFGKLVPACQDNTDAGLRDEIIIRLGLSGMRNNEIATLTLAHVSQLPIINWTGKGRKARSITAGSTLVDLITRWVALRQENGADNGPTKGLMLPVRTGGDAVGGYKSRAAINWTAPGGIDKATIYRIVTTRAKIAGLGHVAPHDLRRTAANILHHATTSDGAHRFDLLDIQKVLGHADPATTMRSYISPIDNGVTARAANVLD